MKHIKKKFLNQFDASEILQVIPKVENYDEVLNRSNKSIHRIDLPNGNISQVIDAKKHDVILVTEDNSAIPTFAYKDKREGKLYALPEADPVLLYFYCAQGSMNNLSVRRKRILEMFTSQEALTELSINEYYDYFGLTSTFTIMLFTSIEAFVNRALPEKYEHKIIARDRTELYTREQFVKKFTLLEKVKALSSELKKDFQYHYPMKFQLLLQLKEFRDEIIHTKVILDGISLYSHFHQTALNLKCHEILEVVKDFINYYSPGLIEECDCGAE